MLCSKLHCEKEFNSILLAELEDFFEEACMGLSLRDQHQVTTPSTFM